MLYRYVTQWFVDVFTVTEISKGDVLFESNNLLCFATTNIYWADIFANGNQQSVNMLRNNIIRNTHPCKSLCKTLVISRCGWYNDYCCMYSSGQPGCHESCAVSLPGLPSDMRYCWGPGPKNCQKMNMVTCAEQCDGGRCFGPESNQCCHAECSGGCDGPSKTDCWVRLTRCPCCHPAGLKNHAVNFNPFIFFSPGMQELLQRRCVRTVLSSTDDLRKHQLQMGTQPGEEICLRKTLHRELPE